MLISSRAKNSDTRSLAPAVKQTPATMVSRQPWYSAVCSSGTSSQLNRTRTAPPTRATTFISTGKRSSQPGTASRAAQADSAPPESGTRRTLRAAGLRLLAVRGLLAHRGDVAQLRLGGPDDRLRVQADQQAQGHDRQQQPHLAGVQVGDVVGGLVPLVVWLPDLAEEDRP